MFTHTHTLEKRERKDLTSDLRTFLSENDFYSQKAGSSTSRISFWKKSHSHTHTLPQWVHDQPEQGEVKQIRCHSCSYFLQNDYFCFHSCYIKYIHKTIQKGESYRSKYVPRFCFLSHSLCTSNVSLDEEEEVIIVKTLIYLKQQDNIVLKNNSKLVERKSTTNLRTD